MPLNEPRDKLGRGHYSRDWNVRGIPWFKEPIQAMYDWLSGFREPGKDKDIKVVYSTPDRAIAKYIAPTVGGQADLPLIVFTLAGADFDQARFLPPFVEFDRKKVDDEWFIYRKPMPWNLSFNVTAMANHQVTLDVISWLIFSRFASGQSYVNVNGIPSRLTLEGFTDGRDLEPGQETRVLRFEYSMMLQAWMPLPFEVYPQINKIIVTLNDSDTGEEWCSQTVE